MNVGGWIKRHSQQIMKSRWFNNRWLRLGFQLLIVFLCLIYLYSNWRSVQEARIELQPGKLFLASGLIIIAIFLGAVGWWLTLLAFGQSISCLDAIRIHIYANLAKYVPGYAWQLLGKAYLTNQMNIKGKVVAVAMTMELGLLFLAGVWVATLSFPSEWAWRWGGENSLSGWLLISRLTSFLLMVMLPFFISWLMRLRQDWFDGAKVRPMGLLLAVFPMVLGWFVFGFSYWMIGTAFHPFSIEKVGMFTFTLAISFLIGLVIVIIPGSIGIRESIMVFLLGPTLGASVSVLIAALSRLALIVSELASALIIWLASRIRH